MKRNWVVFLTIFFCLYSISIKAQWNYSFYFKTASPICDYAMCYDSFGGLTDAEFLNSDTGLYSFSYQISPSSGGGTGSKRTIDGGNTWMGGGSDGYFFTNRKQRTFYNVFNHYPMPPDFSGNRSCALSFSVDGGASWKSLYSRLNFFIGVLFSPDTSQFYFTRRDAFGSSIYLCRYKNRKINDSLLNLTSMPPGDMFFPDTAIGYISSFSKHTLLKTFDGGTSWATVFNDPLVPIDKMFFTNTSNGFALSDSGKIVKTTNGGTTWQQLNYGTRVKLNSLFFLNDSMGFAAGDSGVIIRTTNGGSVWSQDITNTKGSFWKIFFVNDSIGMAFSYNVNSIQRNEAYKINLRSPTGIWEPITDKHLNIVSYPNPATSGITIEIPDLFKSEKAVYLSLYNSSGKLVERKEVLSNTDRVIIDVSEKDKGIYFVTLSGDTEYAKGKIILQ